VLIPETREAHHRRLLDAGFDQVTDWFQCFNFAAMAAIR
jgi:tRNA (cmo5U34)-methyltransferase